VFLEEGNVNTRFTGFVEDINLPFPPRGMERLLLASPLPFSALPLKIIPPVKPTVVIISNNLLTDNHTYDSIIPLRGGL